MSEPSTKKPRVGDPSCSKNEKEAVEMCSECKEFGMTLTAYVKANYMCPLCERVFCNDGGEANGCWRFQYIKKWIGAC